MTHQIGQAPRLLAPEAAATYLGLGSRYAIYRLISSGELPAVRLAGKWRLDVHDLDALIEMRKEKASVAPARSATRPPTGRRRSFTELAPLRPARYGDRTVTAASKVRIAAAGSSGRSDMQSVAPPAEGQA